VLARFSDLRRRGLLVTVCSVGFGACLFAYAWVTSTTVAFIILTIAGFFMIGQMATSNTLIQSTVPAGMRGRVMGMWALNRGAVPFGSLLAGALATLSGAPVAMAIMGGLTLLSAAILVWRLPAVRELA
jgi:MFS family permease